MHASLQAVHSAVEWFERLCASSMAPKTKPGWRKGWKTKEIDRKTGLVTRKTFNKMGQLLVNESYYDPQCIHWPVKVFDKKTGMVTWKRFDKDGSLQVKKFYVPELHDPEFKLPPGYNPQPPAGAADDVLGSGNPEPDRKRRRYADGQDRSMEAEKK